MDRRNTSAGRTAGLGRFELLAVRNTAADLFDDRAKGCSHGNFHKTYVCDLAAEREDLGALGSLCSDRGIPFRTLADDLRYVCICLNVVENCGLLEEAFDCRERRSGTRLAALTFDGSHQSCFFAAYECARAETDLNVKAEVCAEDILAEKAVLSGLLDRDLETLNSDRVLRTHIDITLAGADRITCDRHSLEYCVRVAFQNGTIHERARIAFIRVAAYILDIGLGRFTERPLSACRESCAASSAKSGCEHNVNNLILGHGCQDLIQCLIAVQSDIFLDILRVDHAAVSQRDTHLLGIEIGLAQRKDLAVLMHSLGIQKILADQAFHNVLINDALCAFRRCL